MGTSLSWPVNEVEIVSARLGLASQWQPDGSVLVVPAYEFTDADGGTWSVIAVAESMLDFASEYPGSQPAPAFPGAGRRAKLASCPSRQKCRRSSRISAHG